MAELPLEIILDILSRMPIKSLARFRCVSKVWCQHIDDDPYIPIISAPIIMLFQKSSHPYRIRILSLCKKLKKYTDLEMKKDPLLEFEYSPALSNHMYPPVMVQGSCNGWLFLSLLYGDEVETPVVVHPIRKETYQVPQMLHRRVSAKLCGLGFDASTNTFKMVCVLPKRNKQKLYTMVHVFGTHSWRKISQVPSYPIIGRSIFAQGCLYWLVVIEREVPMDDDIYKVIWFDVMNEKFGMIDPPRITKNSCRMSDHLVNLNGEVGFVFDDRDMKVWVLKQEKWVH